MNAVDTNVLVYAYDLRDSCKRDIATALIESGDGNVLLWQVACEFIAAARKLAPQAFDAKTAWERLQDIRNLMPLVLPSASVLETAKCLVLDHQAHFWDAMIFSARLEAGVEKIYSEDLPGMKIEGLQVINPFQS